MDIACNITATDFHTTACNIAESDVHASCDIAESDAHASLDDADLHIKELLDASETNRGSIIDNDDDKYVCELLSTPTRFPDNPSETPTDNDQAVPKVDMDKLRAMVAGMMQNAATKSATDKEPTTTREALRMKLKQKQLARLSKYAINAQSEKLTAKTTTAPTT